MRTKTIIDGFKNSQKFRFILLAESGEEVGMVITISQMSEQFATRNARMSVWSALSKLAIDRRMAEIRGETKPSGIVTDAFGFRQVQVDLH
jgi:hypothetical protein